MIDALAYEIQFLSHISPVWRALPAELRGRFIVDPSLAGQAAALGIEAVPVPRPMVDRGRLIPPNVGAARPALVASYGDTKEARRLGYGPLSFLEHGAGQSYDSRAAVMASYAGGPDRSDTELFLVPNEYCASRWRAAYPASRVEVVGSPRLDDLPAREPDPGPDPVVAISWHFDGPNVPYGGTALHDGYGNVLRDVARRWQVIGHAHPRWADRMARMYRRLGIEFAGDFDEVCRRSDIYACDNSSTLFEYASTGRPVVVVNAQRWHRGRGPGLRFWDAAHVGVNVDRPRDLVAGIERALELRPVDVAAREDALGFVYAHRSGGARRAATAIADWLAGLEAAAA